MAEGPEGGLNGELYARRSAPALRLVLPISDFRLSISDSL